MKMIIAMIVCKYGQVWIKNKIEMLTKKFNDIETNLFDYEKFTKNRNNSFKSCLVKDCNVKTKLYKCKTCKFKVCIDHLTDEFENDVTCACCIPKQLQLWQKRIQKLQEQI